MALNQLNSIFQWYSFTKSRKQAQTKIIIRYKVVLG